MWKQKLQNVGSVQKPLVLEEKSRHFLLSTRHVLIYIPCKVRWEEKRVRVGENWNIIFSSYIHCYKSICVYAREGTRGRNLRDYSAHLNSDLFNCDKSNFQLKLPFPFPPPPPTTTTLKASYSSCFWNIFTLTLHSQTLPCLHKHFNSESAYIHYSTA